MSKTRIDQRFANLREEGRPALITFVMAGDPDTATALEIVKSLPQAGADLIEIGMPFSDPMADGPSIQLAGQRALKAGQTLAKTLEMVREFRKDDDDTPVILMGYYNPIYAYGNERFLKDASDAGVDGLIVVDVPAEADDELCLPAREYGLNFIRLVTPTTDAARLERVLDNVSGFLYYVSITGITGAAAPDPAKVGQSVARVKQSTELPIVVGFGVTTAAQARAIGEISDGVVVGSALVNAVRDSLDENGQAGENTVGAVAQLVGELAKGVRAAGKSD